MCGIAGIVDLEERDDSGDLERMLAALRHRGPDGSGSFHFPACSLGHTRLSIVDLEGGSQPMLGLDGSVGITFNGEIYGYRDIRSSLPHYPFRTHSDTEVILALHDRHGEGLLPHLPGMFAFALWDERRRRLFCARDRFGEKPFYYAIGRHGELVFASEIKALLASGRVDPELSLESLAHYLRKGYIHPLRTVYSNIQVLPPAHALLYEGGRLRTWRYWSPPTPADRLDLPEATVEFRRLFERAVERQLIADVPVGAFLSGGLDSSSVVATACARHPRIRTLSFGFAGGHDELPFARDVARRFDTDHVEMRADGEDLATLLVHMQQVYDEPFADSSNIPTYLLCREARKHLKVVLTGDGGDELLGGYAWYQPLVWLERHRGSSAATYATARLLLALLDRRRIRRLDRLRERSRGIVLGRRYRSVSEAHAGEDVLLRHDEIEALGLTSRGLDIGSIDDYPAPGSVDDAMRMDVLDYMPGDILVKTDRASMAHGLELRAPFLDVEFAEFCLTLPSRLKLDGHRDKIILREAYAAQWPASVRARSKQGFGAPVSAWLEDPSIQRLAQRHLLSPSAAIRDVLRLKRNESIGDLSGHRGWILLVLAVWLETSRSQPRRGSADEEVGKSCVRGAIEASRPLRGTT